MFYNQKRPFNFLLFMLSVFVASSLLFLDGFFLVHNSQIGKTGSQYHDSIQSKLLDEYVLQLPSLKYDQIILLVIDAFRADYPNATNMPFTYENVCNHLQIKVDMPTVTMPRIKSLTTGTISNFIDIVLNLGHTKELDESILHRLTEKNKTSVFAGDRTWIDMFPNKFLRAAVNSDSFFVNDFYEGDLNVTKALKDELQYSDWQLMVLHYLGLDHIGHVEGSHSEKIYLKLLEMDNIIKYIEANMNARSLVLLTGDHGMRNGGGHGGSDMEELYVPFMVFQKSCNKKKRSYTEYNQIDISATLAVLLDVKIPHTSIGCLIPELLEGFSKEEQLYLLYYNALHLMEKLKSRFNLSEIGNEDYFTWFRNAKTSHKEFISSQSSSIFSYEEAKQNYIRLSKNISLVLSESKVHYNIPQIFIALSLATLCAMKLLTSVIFEIVPNSIEANNFWWKKCLICLGLTVCINFYAHYYNILNTSVFGSIIFIPFIALSIYFAFDVFKLIFVTIVIPLILSRKVMLKLSVPSVLLSLFLVHTLSLGSSSFIEEEHQTWYYFTPSLLLFLTVQNFYNDVRSDWQNQKPIDLLLKEIWKLRFVFIVLLSLIGCRRLNQTGDKWRHIVDIGDILSRSENRLFLTLSLLIGLILLYLILKKYNSPLEMLFCLISLSCIFLYRQMNQNYSFSLLVLFWTSLLCAQLRHCRYVFYKRNNFRCNTGGNLVELLRTNLTCCFLISALLHKPHNVILLPALIHTLEKSYQLCDNLHIKYNRVYSRCYLLVLKTVMTIFIANMFYFYQGNSNSLATIDLNPGYIGLSSYNPIVVGLFITFNTYCASISAFMYLMWHMFHTQINALPLRQEKEQISNFQLVESTQEDLHMVYSLFTASTIMPVAVYWCLLIGFRHHLFIYSVFAPKALYECFHLLVFYINFIVTNLYFRLFLN